MQFMGSPRPGQEDEELQQALRASLSCTEWISQSPPLHLELIPSGDAAAATVESDFEAPVTFLGCMPLPEFLSKLADILPTNNDHSRHVFVIHELF